MTYAGALYNPWGDWAQSYVGADGQSYPEVASRAVRSVHAQRRSPYYGYIRSGVNQKIYLFRLLEDARSWFGQHVELQPDHDYAAVFAASNLQAPMPGMEHFNRPTSGDPTVGNWWPLLLGLPVGALGGYFLRRWQEPASARALVPPLREAARPLLSPGESLPPFATPPTAGGWYDIDDSYVGQEYGYGGYSDGYGDYSVGGPWLDVVGAQADDAARRRSWPQTRALIQSAIDEVKEYAATYPAAAYVWQLDEAGPSSRPGVTLAPTTLIAQFPSQPEALAYLREVAQTRPVGLALFERSSPHWPNPTAWRKSDDPEHEMVIAHHIANRLGPPAAGTQTSGTYAGADAVVGAAIDDVRRRAQDLANRRAGSVVGVIHTSRDGLWHTLAFRSADDADDWLNTATQDQSAYTYAAYFDKEGDSWPDPYIEKIGGFRAPRSSQKFRRAGIVGAGGW